jgi:AcrR family transcriptional regulator
MSKGQETKQAILGEALDLASTVGLSGLTIGSLASATGMSKSGLYAHFRSKEQLQVQVLEEARRRFIDVVMVPALKQPRGVPRLVAIMKNALGNWENDLPGGCVFYAVAAELDDQPGPARDYLIKTQSEQAETIRRMAQGAVEEGQFREDLDLDQFVFEFGAISAAYHHFGRLLGDPKAEERARKAFESLLARSR